MSEVKVNKISPRTNCGTVQLGDSGDTITIPAGATITNNGTQTGFGRTGTVDWETTPKTANFTAVSGDGFFCNTTSSAFTATLPAGSAGAIVSFADYAATWQTNNLTVSPDGTDKIGGTNSDVTLSTEGQSVTFIYVDDTQGWINTMDSTSNVRGNAFLEATGGTVTTCGNCKIHTFTGPGTFTVSAAAACSANNVVSYMVVAGGGGGGSACSGGGGGAGGFREYKSPVTPYTASPLNGNPGGTSITVSAQAYPITVGGGGTGGSPYTGPSAANSFKGGSGANSVFSTVTSAGGGGGGAEPAPGINGGSGGGGAHSAGSGGTGNTPPVSPSQGNNGAASAPGSGPAPSDAGGGGGGATAAGTPGSTNHTGGAGASTSISGSSTTYAGGGGGTNRCAGDANDVAGGSGGGGRGGFGPRPGPLAPSAGESGTANTGGGGGGGKPNNANSGPTRPYGGSGTGGSGIVIIRYKYQ